MRFLLCLAAGLVVAGCSATSRAPDAPASGPAVADRLVGRWEMSRVLDRGEEATDIHNPGGDRYVLLRADGTFESGGQPYGRNTGRWIYDPSQGELTLDSDLGPEDDTFWIVTLDGDEMEWAGVRSEAARRFRVLSVKADR